MFSKTTDAREAPASFITRRWSGVAFDPDRDITDTLLLGMAEAARWAPSCFGDQPWRFVFCRRSSHPDAWHKAFDCLLEGNQAWSRQAPLLALICADTLLTRNDKPNPYGHYDTGAAAVSLCLQAASQGIMTHQMGGFNRDRARTLFGIPQRYTPTAMLAAGYQLAEADIPAEFQGRETAPRERRPLADSFFAGEWGEGL